MHDPETAHFFDTACIGSAYNNARIKTSGCILEINRCALLLLDTMYEYKQLTELNDRLFVVFVASTSLIWQTY